MNQLTKPGVSVVIPAYNEQPALGVLFAELSETAARMKRPFQFIFVDDGSTDRTASLIASVASTHPGSAW